jgi:indolepyruvate ferredoxin oxidoreductase alpha subunit
MVLPMLLDAGRKIPLLGNEAIALGALEAGVDVVTGYPGTPSSEVIESLFRFVKEGLGQMKYLEWAINEKVALEIALGAAMGGRRSLVTMKGPGISIAADPLLSSAYCGVDAGMVVLVADDPGPITTQTEQDSRWYAKVAKLPMIEPSNPDEARAFMTKAIQLSELVRLPILLRTTTRVNHAVGEVIPSGERDILDPAPFKKDAQRYVRASMSWNRSRHSWLLGRLAQVPSAGRNLELDRSYPATRSTKFGFIVSGSASNYVLDGLEESKVTAEVLKLGLLNPLDSIKIEAFLRRKPKVMVVEETDPFLENGIKAIAQSAGIRTKILGREEALFPTVGELDVPLVKNAIRRFLGRREIAPVIDAPRLPDRPPPMCPGCPHMGSYFGLLRGIAKAGFKKENVPIFGDIGCYALALNPPFEAVWTEHSMGASISMAAGLKVSGYISPVVAVIGDSTFYHSGIQPLVEAVNKRVDLVVVVMDNSTVAMTGHQNTPASRTSASGRRVKPIMLKQILRSVGVDSLSVVDAYEPPQVTEAVRRALLSKGVNVVLVERACVVLNGVQGSPEPFRVIADLCTACDVCINLLGCPALMVEAGKVAIREEDCSGCALCAGICPYKAIVRGE